MKNIQLTIPKPCHENWQQMTPVEKGKFCAACQKKVHDFTRATDREIVKAYEADSKLCGRFLSTQLERELIVPKENKSVWVASILFGMLFLSDSKVVAQEKPKIEQSEPKNFIVGKIAQPENHIDNKFISGVISDASGPLPGASIFVKGTNRGTTSDFQGKYTINASEGETLIFSFMGMEEELRVVSSSNNINILLKESETRLGESFIVGSIAHRKRTFFGRTIQNIKNWFRSE